MQPRMAVNVAQHKIVNLPKTLGDFFVIMCHSVFHVWPRDAKRLGIRYTALHIVVCAYCMYFEDYFLFYIIYI